MELQMRKALKEATWKRYRKAPKKMKTKILDELCAATGYHRQYAIAQLNQMEDAEPRRIRICFSAVSARVFDFDSLSHPVAADEHKSRLGGCQDRKDDHVARLGGCRTHGSHEYRRKPSAATDEPEIARTSPSALGDNQGKYSAGGSAAQRHSWKAA